MRICSLRHQGLSTGESGGVKSWSNHWSILNNKIWTKCSRESRCTKHFHWQNVNKYLWWTRQWPIGKFTSENHSTLTENNERNDWKIWLQRVKQYMVLPVKFGTLFQQVVLHHNKSQKDDPVWFQAVTAYMVQSCTVSSWSVMSVEISNCSVSILLDFCLTIPFMEMKSLILWTILYNTNTLDVSKPLNMKLSENLKWGLVAILDVEYSWGYPVQIRSEISSFIMLYVHKM